MPPRSIKHHNNTIIRIPVGYFIQKYLHAISIHTLLRSDWGHIDTTVPGSREKTERSESR